MSDTRKISICIPTYNRYDFVIKAIEQVIADDRVEEICIVDDCSTNGDDILLAEWVKTYPKIAFFRNNENLDCYRNKCMSMQYSHGDWCILFDSDNILTTAYLDTLYAIPEWNKETIYQPQFARPHFDFREFAGVTITCKNTKQYIYNNDIQTTLETALNAMNFFINRDIYLQVWDGSVDPVTSDSIYFSYCWLERGYKILITPGLEYDHLVHEAHYQQNVHRTGNFHRELLLRFETLGMKLAFDIGAHIGEKTEDLLKFTDHVVAFEPNPNLQRVLQKRLRGQNVFFDNHGIDNHDGINRFKICDAYSLSTFSDSWKERSRFSQDHYWDIELDVPVMTIDTAITVYGIPEYIKIDVEGYELHVLRGLSHLLPNTTICFEWAEEDVEDIKQAISYIKQLGYTAFYYTEGDDIKTGRRIYWATWEELDFFADINPERKQRWGMIYFKKEINRYDNRWIPLPKESSALSFDTIYAGYVNLDKRPDRNQHMLKELQRVGLHAERFTGYLPDEVYTFIPSHKLAGMEKRGTRGAIGCHYSQVGIMEKALAQGKTAWVQEDDLVYCDDIQDRLKTIFDFLNTHEWDIFWFGGTWHNEPTWHRSENGHHTHPDLWMCECNLNKDWEPTEHPNIVRTYGAFSTHSYLVNIKSLSKILDLLDQNVYRSMGIDWIMLLIQPQLHAYAFSPGCCKQFDNQSNIGSGISYFSGFENLGPHWFANHL